MEPVEPAEAVSTSEDSYWFKASAEISASGTDGLDGNWKALTALAASFSDTGVGLKALIWVTYKSEIKLDLCGVTEKNLLEANKRYNSVSTNSNK